MTSEQASAGRAGPRDKKWFQRVMDEYDYQRPQRGDVVDATITQVEDHSLLVDIGGKRDAVVPADDLKRLDDEYVQSLGQGDQVQVVVVGRSRQAREMLVSIEQALQQEDWERAEALRESSEVQELEVTGYNRGGLLVQFGSLEGFVPNSHVPDLAFRHEGDDGRAEKAGRVGTQLPVRVLEVDPRQRRLVLSARLSANQRSAMRLNELSEGQVLTGRVTGLADFGAFVDLGGVRGLIHISELGWRHFDHPSEALQVGDEVEVKIKRLDLERRRIGLSRKALLPNPWQSIRYQVGEVMEGEVTQSYDFGTFVRLPDGLEGLVPRSEIERPPPGSEQSTEPRPGDTVQVRIAALEPERERIRLSLLRLVTPEPEPQPEPPQEPES